MATAAEYVTDFEAILDQLRRAGYTFRALEQATGVSRAAISDYAVLGATPLHPNGERLIELWCQVMTVSRDALPMRRAQLSAHKVLR